MTDFVICCLAMGGTSLVVGTIFVVFVVRDKFKEYQVWKNQVNEEIRSIDKGYGTLTEALGLAVDGLNDRLPRGLMEQDKRMKDVKNRLEQQIIERTSVRIGRAGSRDMYQMNVVLRRLLVELGYTVTEREGLEFTKDD